MQCVANEWRENWKLEWNVEWNVEWNMEWNIEMRVRVRPLLVVRLVDSASAHDRYTLLFWPQNSQHAALA